MKVTRVRVRPLGQVVLYMMRTLHVRVSQTMGPHRAPSFTVQLRREQHHPRPKTFFTALLPWATILSPGEDNKDETHAALSCL